MFKHVATREKIILMLKTTAWGCKYVPSQRQPVKNMSLFSATASRSIRQIKGKRLQ